jgi:hypothetical protein
MPDTHSLQKPVLSRADFTTPRFLSMLTTYGCVLARGLFSMSEVLALRGEAEAAYRDYDRAIAETDAGRTPPESPHIKTSAYTTDRESIGRFRKFGSLPLARCPHASSVAATVLSASPLRLGVEAYFQDQIGLSLNASSVRLSEVSNDTRRVFHQDGNFLGGADAQTVNCWIALDPCGVHAPAMEVYPHRVPDLLQAGDADSIVPWEISEEAVYARFGKENMWIPEFSPGDAFIFDHLHVHRTHLSDAMTRDRFAMENWMFPITERYRHQFLAWLG